MREYFDKVQVINLRFRADRRKEMTRELERHGMPPEPGKVEFFEAVRKETAEGFPTAGLHGCFLSHLGVLKRAKADGLSRVLVFEDDCQLTRRLGAYQGSIVEELRGQPWDLVYFGHVLDVGPVDPKATPRLSRYTQDIGLLHFYGVNHTVFDRLIEFLEASSRRPPGDPDGGPMSPDGAVSYFRSRNPDVVTLVAVPSLGWQRSSRNDNHPRPWAERIPIVRDLMDVARRAKSLVKSYR
jgi:glycosyl transferase, family 25